MAYTKIYAAVLTAIVGLFAPAESRAQNPLLSGALTGNVGITTDYTPRGITQSDEQPAVHAEVTYAYKNGIYFNPQITSISYDYDDRAHAEVDLCAGIKKPVAGFTLDFSGCWYYYPGTASAMQYNFWEFRTGASRNFGPVYTSLILKRSADYWLGTGESLFSQLFAMVPLKHNFSLMGEVGHQDVENNARFGIPDYTYGWGGVAYQHQSYQAILKYVDTDLNKSECYDGCEKRVTLTLVKYF